MASIEKFIYVHILKTAGTTLRYTLFEKHFKGRYLYDATFKPKLNKLAKDTHPAIIEPQPYPDNYEDYDVIFGHFNYKKYVHLHRPMFSFVRHPVDRMINQYYYHRGFYEKRGMNIGIIEFSRMWKNHMSYVLGDINNFKFIGVVEEFKKSLNRMCDIIGVEKPKQIKSMRFFGDNQVVSKNIRKKIAKINSEDMELYYKVLEDI